MCTRWPLLVAHLIHSIRTAPTSLCLSGRTTCASDTWFLLSFHSSFTLASHSFSAFSSLELPSLDIAHRRPSACPVPRSKRPTDIHPRLPTLCRAIAKLNTRRRRRQDERERAAVRRAGSLARQRRGANPAHRQPRDGEVGASQGGPTPGLLHRVSDGRHTQALRSLI